MPAASVLQPEQYRQHTGPVLLVRRLGDVVTIQAEEHIRDYTPLHYSSLHELTGSDGSMIILEKQVPEFQAALLMWKGKFQERKLESKALAKLQPRGRPH